MLPCSPDCPLCGGLGFVRREAADINDPAFGKLDPCPQSFKYNWDPQLGIDEAESRSLGWHLFRSSPSMDVLKPALNTLLDRGFGWLYLWGEPGLGKTVAVKTAAVLAHYKYKKSARYLTHSGLNNFLRSSFDEDNGQLSFSKRLDNLVNLDFLAIDEVGRDRSTDFGISAFSDLLDRRYIAAVSQKSITVFISNFPPSKVLDNYQLDRVLDGRFSVLHVQGSSLRSAMAFKQQTISSEVPWWQNL